MKRKKIHLSERASGIATVFVFISLVVSVLFSIAAFILSSNGRIMARQKEDYLLMVIQCVLGIAVMFLPNLLKKRFGLSIPNIMNILFVLFVYAGIVLGEVRNFYYTVPHWDTVLHTFSGGMLGALGFSIVDLFNSHEKVKVELSEAFVAMFAFCFALSMGALWEIYEFAGDSLLNLNMQKHSLEGGIKLAGQAALLDTMKDLIVDAIGALFMTLIGYFSIKQRKRSGRSE